MPLGTEVGLGPGCIVLDMEPAPPWKRGTAAPSTFPPMSIVAKRAGWIRIPLGTEVGHGPGDIVLDGDLALATEMGTAAPPPMSSVSATAELLLKGFE